MKKSTITIIVLVVLAAIVAFSGCGTYNTMVTLDENCSQVWAQVETQYQRRLDLIPSLVETVKGYAKHESETYEKVTQARASLTDAYNEAKAAQEQQGDSQEDFTRYNDAQSDLGKAFNIYVNAVKEAYPDLKADKQFSELQVQLEGTENRIATERHNYTVAVKEYNVTVKQFPNNIWAGFFGFAPKPQYQAEAAAASAPKVSF